MIQLNIDCEGPLTQNDNAFELCRDYIPNGDKFFPIVSKYDDFLADVIKKPGYKAGDTLKLVLPFLKAFDVTDEIMEKFSEKTLILLPGTQVMLPMLKDLFPSFIISTSYKPYLEALCKLTSFPIENCYCTEVSLDKYELPLDEKEALKALAMEIAGLEMFDWPESATSLEDLEPRYQQIITRLDEIFWNIIPQMSIGAIFNDVNPVGGSEKARSVKASLKTTGLDLSKVVYAGDSITDSQALELVRENGGTAISFNGNYFALREANYAVLSENTCIIPGLCSMIKDGPQGILDSYLISDSDKLDVEKLIKDMANCTPEQIIRELEGVLNSSGVLEIRKIEKAPSKELIEKSEKIRKEVRGKKIGALG